MHTKIHFINITLKWKKIGKEEKIKLQNYIIYAMKK